MLYPSIAAVMAENSVRDELVVLKAKPVHFDLKSLTQVASNYISAHRVVIAEDYLIQIYGLDIPPSEYLDRVFGLDVVIQYRGWKLGLDITLNEDAVKSKQQKQQGLRPAYKALGIDAWGVIIAGQDLKTQLSQIIRGAQ
jgi:hypothetical protein